MTLNRRDLLKSLGGACSALAVSRFATSQVPAEHGKFQGTRESLRRYQIPDWFRDAKFGIWAHWGPQSAAEDGDWYARKMYIEGSPQYNYHLKTYGHPSKFGYKDLVHTWHAERFDPEHLMDLYKAAGAKYFVSMGVHHDNFDLWNSKYHPTWNSVANGPHKDIVGLFKEAAIKRGMKFGVSEHLGPSYHWYGPAYGADKQGSLAGVPYDGRDPHYAELYHPVHAIPKRADGTEDLDNEQTMPDSWKREYLLRMEDLIDNYEPDLLYTDGPVRNGDWGLATIAHLYNRSAMRHGGKVEAVYNAKHQRGATDCAVGTCALDMERGILDGISDLPWQTDTCIGGWHYDRTIYTNNSYKSPKKVIDMLVDIVSKNGNLLLNFPLRSDGTLDEKELAVLEGITAWMTINGEAIYGSRPWKIYGEGPSAQVKIEASNFSEDKQSDLKAEDIRFTSKGSTLYAFVMGFSANDAVINALGLSSPHSPGAIHNVEILGYEGKVKWKQDAAGLKVQMPADKISDLGIALKVQLT
jgi:alpha-L-fucosidase